MNILVTCFGPFSNFNENPSQLVMNRVKDLSSQIQNVNFEWEVLDVKYFIVDKFIEHFHHHHNLTLHLGVATGSSRLRFELVAKNIKDGTDNDGINYSNSLIHPEVGNLSTTIPFEFIQKFVQTNSEKVDISNDAGSYLCNYIYFKSLMKYKEKSNIIFIHLADFQNNVLASSLEEQAVIILSFIKEFLNYEQEFVIHEI